ncbi:MAG: hypothetical protein DI596_04220 [Azospira oryzae]|nr:MAG: hypothetical protein DI596_04220 [Azospira oryzae]PZP81417.1 MAG: hypothetical protein DI593_04220 [Azospira oryzae]
MNDQQLLRYSRHILLPEIGIEGQERILAAHALVIGAGGLGSPVALYLASAGIGTLTLCDGDAVDLTNLQRQIVHRSDAIGLPKVESAKRTLATINPEVQVEAAMHVTTLLLILDFNYHPHPRRGSIRFKNRSTYVSRGSTTW